MKKYFATVQERDAAVAAVTAEVEEEGLKYVAEVYALCNAVGAPEKAGGFLTAWTPIETVRSMLGVSAPSTDQRPSTFVHAPLHDSAPATDDASWAASIERVHGKVANPFGQRGRF